ncbi:hypothetical protein [Actinomadura sp.]|uniref:hypothetical protein n=1 Tax=Actinomadura sp. TaxID=1989 RepID=UPI0037CB4DCF
MAADQALDGSDLPAAEPAEPVPDAADTGGDFPRRRWWAAGRRRWAVGAGALVLVAGGVGWAVSASSGDSAPARFTSMPKPCELVPGETLERYVPRSDPPVPNEAANSADERYEACEWAEPPGAKGVRASHRLSVSVRLHLDGAASAKAEYDAAWDGANSMAGTAKGAPGSLHAEAPSVARIGDQAFTQHLTLSGPLGATTTAAATARLRNAVITVRFRGTRSPLDVDGSPKTREAAPMDEATALAGAEAAARGIADTLAACEECLSG